jgi:glycosyltransferase involved in cell wall biosynthesis
MSAALHRDRIPALAVTWEIHRRTRELCDWFGLPLHELTYSAPALRRYAHLGWRTLRLLSQQRPKVVYVQNPSLILSLLVLAARPFLGRYRVLMDAHNEAVTPYTHAYWPVTSLTRLALRAADITIVTNAALADEVRRIGGTPQILPDRLPTPPQAPRQAPAIDGQFRVMVVATYAADEPISDIIAAGRILGDQFQLRITGRETKLPAEQRAGLPSNVQQTGFLAEEDYWQLMHDSHLILDLTLKPNCLVCGAYESLAMLRPMVLTDNPATVDLFGNVAVFPKSAARDDIVTALRQARDRYPQLLNQINEAHPAFLQRWTSLAETLRQRLSEWLDKTPRQDADRGLDSRGLA